ncbi:MAG: V-type ATPase 116kDa subunit family protein [Candidatus Hydrothermarchaeales archaeon]
MFRPAVMVKLYCTFYKGYKERVLYRLQELGLVQFFDIKENTQLEAPTVEIRHVMRALERTNRILVAIPSRRVPVLHKVFGPPAVFVKVVQEPKESLLETIEEKLDVIEKKFLEVEKSGDKAAMRDFGEKYYQELLTSREELQNLADRTNALEEFGRTDYTMTFGAWVPKKHMGSVKDVLKDATDGSCLISVEDPKKGEDIPVLLDNPGILKPFELLTVNYGIPTYGSIDPTPFLAVTFTIFFGMMFGDVGYGLILALLSFFAYMKTTKAEQAQRDINVILIFGALAGVIFGAYVGEIFGGLIHVETPWHGRELLENVGLLLAISVGIGVFHITLSCLSRSVGTVMLGKLPIYPLAILLILWSGTILIISTTEAAGELITTSLVIKLKYTLAAGVALLTVKKKFEVFDELISLFANTISYVRIGILSTLHVILAGIVAGIILGLPTNIFGLIIGVIVFVLGVAFLLTLGVFISFIHTLRLHWLEFFKRFYSGMGESFKTFSAKREVTLTL